MAIPNDKQIELLKLAINPERVNYSLDITVENDTSKGTVHISEGKERIIEATYKAQEGPEIEGLESMRARRGGIGATLDEGLLTLLAGYQITEIKVGVRMAHLDYPTRPFVNPQMTIADKVILHLPFALQDPSRIKQYCTDNNIMLQEDKI